MLRETRARCVMICTAAGDGAHVILCLANDDGSVQQVDGVAWMAEEVKRW